MTAAPAIVNAAAIAMLDYLTGLLDAGPGAGYIEIRTGGPPATCDDAATGSVLATITLADPAFNAAVDSNPGATATADTIAPVFASVSGTAGWFRAYDSTGTAVIQGNCGTSASDMILNNTSLVNGVQVNVNSWTIYQPEKT